MVNPQYPLLKKTERHRPGKVWRRVDGVLLLDKPVGISSTGALQRARWLIAAEKAGHTGALDPLATGVLPLCFGDATKFSSYLLDGDKRYLADVKLGYSTTTGDGEGGLLERSDSTLVDRELIERIMQSFVGPIQQIPPMYSAIRREGVRLYELARSGETVERDPRDVVIHSLHCVDWWIDADGLPCFRMAVDCSKGTYIRTLAEDVAVAAGQQAHLVALRRTGAAPFGEEQLVTLEQLEQLVAPDGNGADHLLMRTSVIFRDRKTLTVTAIEAERLAKGQRINVGSARAADLDPKDLVVLDEAGDLLGIAEIELGQVVAPRRWMRAR